MMGSPESEPERESDPREFGGREGADSPQRKVTIVQHFAVGRHAVTRGHFAAFVNNTGHVTVGED
jgi:formylglycine-generating enzyme required for sulfatase activity